MPKERITVVAYSGYKGDERPQSFLRNREEIEVLEILSAWIEERIEDRRRRRFFEVRGSDGSIHKIYYDERDKEWFYVMPH